MTKRAYRIENIAEDFDMNSEQLRRLCKSGAVGFKIGGLWYVTREDMDAYIESQKQRSAEATFDRLILEDKDGNSK